MSRLHIHTERHLVDRIGWLRAAVLGANDGIVSTASLVIGVAASSATKQAVLVAGVAGLIAGAMSMAAGEYVSVSSQSDTENADLARERAELAAAPEAELAELASIYEARGVDADTAHKVAVQLTAHDAMAAHARDELGISHITTAQPVQAALTSAATFSVGAGLPLLIAVATTPAQMPLVVGVGALVSLAALGAVGARAGGAGILRSVLRVTFWGAFAMALTAGVGHLFGAVV